MKAGLCCVQRVIVTFRVARTARKFLTWDGHPHLRGECMATRETHTGRVRKNGNSHSLTLPPSVREALNIRPGDLCIMRMFGKVLIVRRLDPSMVIDLDSIPADAIPSSVRS
jgi:antitoxin component of MazEF toxin-antitoxin module